MTRFGLLLASAALILGLVAVPSIAQDGGGEFSVLVYTRTEGFRHVSIPSGVAAVQDLGEQNGFSVEHTEDPAAFTDDNLQRFAAVIFLNTTGDVVPPDGEAAFERYVRGGGGYVGIHSAADTEYDWEFYGEILGGAWFANHPVQQPGVIVVEDQQHPSTAHLPEQWAIPFEEFYSFQANPRPNVHVLFSIDESSYQQDPNTSNLPNSPTYPEGETGTMGDHPMSWCHDIDAGHVWYTALGHENYLYETPDFRQHILGGILTSAGRLEADCPVDTASAESPETPSYPPEPPDETEEEAAPAEERPLPATGGGVAVFGLLLAAAWILRDRGTDGQG